jgi:AcrR family transcriptional regulator
MDAERVLPGAPAVKGRRYDASRRRAEAARTRDRVLDIAERMLLDDGFAATSVAAIARAAGVSPELVYKVCGGKAGLVLAIVNRALLGQGTVPAEARSDAVAATDIDARSLLLEWSRLATEVSPLGSPIVLLVRSGAAADPALAALLDEISDLRLERMALNAARLVQHPGVRPELSVDQVRDVLWTYSAPDLYDLLVVQRGWAVDRFGDFIFRGMSGQLLET